MIAVGCGSSFLRVFRCTLIVSFSGLVSSIVTLRATKYQYCYRFGRLLAWLMNDMKAWLGFLSIGVDHAVVTSSCCNGDYRCYSHAFLKSLSSTWKGTTGSLSAWCSSVRKRRQKPIFFCNLSTGASFCGIMGTIFVGFFFLLFQRLKRLPAFLFLPSNNDEVVYLSSFTAITGVILVRRLNDLDDSGRTLMCSRINEVGLWEHSYSL